MAHKSITVSEDAYNALRDQKKENESFTDVIIRLTGQKRRKKRLIEWLESKEPLDELAMAVEKIHQSRSSWSFRERQ